MLNIIVGAIALFVFGAFWYTFAFGKVWERLMEFSPESKARAKERGMTQGLIGNFVSNLIAISVVYYVFPQMLVLDFSDFIKNILIVWFGFSFPIYANSYLWEGKSWKLVALNSAYGVVYFILASSIVYYWPN